MNKAEEDVWGLIREMNNASPDLVIQNPQMLWEWGSKAIMFWADLGTDLVSAKRQYWKQLNLCRKETKSKADAEIMAMDSDAWETYERKKLLWEAGEQAIQMIKQFRKMMEEERRVMQSES